MQKYAVLIVGMGGLGVEVAKNVILAGVKSVAIHDLEPTALSDLSSQFYLSEAALGMPRAAACVDQLKELNQYVSVSLVTEPLTEAVVKVSPRVGVVVVAGPPPFVRGYHHWRWPSNFLGPLPGVGSATAATPCHATTSRCAHVHDIAVQLYRVPAAVQHGRGDERPGGGGARGAE